MAKIQNWVSEFLTHPTVQGCPSLFRGLLWTHLRAPMRPCRLSAWLGGFLNQLGTFFYLKLSKSAQNMHFSDQWLMPWKNVFFQSNLLIRHPTPFIETVKWPVNISCIFFTSWKFSVKTLSHYRIIAITNHQKYDILIGHSKDMCN